MLKIVWRRSVQLNNKWISSSCIARARVVEKVPPLGESITEGSIAKWCRNIGDVVKVDDVIVIVETDKVTVDIKSPHAGTLTQQLAKETVSVGADLYELETSVDFKMDIANQAAQVPQTASTIPPESQTHHSNSHNRIPSIKFIGKRSIARSEDCAAKPKCKQAASASAAAAAAVTTPSVVGSGKAVDFWTLKGGATYGRPLLSAAEIAAVESGGATVAI